MSLTAAFTPGTIDSVNEKHSIGSAQRRNLRGDWHKAVRALPIEFIELSHLGLAGNCFMGIESTFYNSVVAAVSLLKRSMTLFAALPGLLWSAMASTRLLVIKPTS